MDRLIRPRSPATYARLGKDLRHYFYAVDTRGLLYLEEAAKRNVATALKDTVFLRSLFTLLRPNTTGHYQTYPLVSPCGREQNFLMPEDPLSALTFTELNSDGGDLLYAGAQLKEPFDPSRLAYSADTGRLYHPLSSHKHLKSQFGLLHPQTTQSLPIHQTSPGSFSIDWQGKCVPIQTLS